MRASIFGIALLFGGVSVVAADASPRGANSPVGSGITGRKPTAPHRMPGDADTREWLKLSGFIGARLYSSESSLGSPQGTSLRNSILLGARGEHRLSKWITLEGELPLSITQTRDGNATAFVLMPRVHSVFELTPRKQTRPFILAGVGAPLLLSSNTDILTSPSLRPEFYLGGGIRFDRVSGWSVRVDGRLSLVPARDSQVITPEVEFFLSVYYWDEKPAPPPPPDTSKLDDDGDGIANGADRCPDRKEDHDQFKDDDGCPDYDDDNDEVLDEWDTCRFEPETWNGYKDDDGCPDTLPAQVAGLEGVIKGVYFRRASDRLFAKSRRMLVDAASILKAYPSVRGRIAVHVHPSGDDDADLALSQRRAAVVQAVFAGLGIGEDRLGAVGLGADAPVSDGTDLAARAANERVVFSVRRRETRK